MGRDYLFKRLTAKQVVGLKRPIKLFWPTIALVQCQSNSSPLSWIPLTSPGGKNVMCLNVASGAITTFEFRKEQQAAAFLKWYKKAEGKIRLDLEIAETKVLD